MTRNQIEYWSLQETKAHNQRTWSETVRSNKAREREIYRHNRETEDLGNRNLLEITRHNRATELLGQDQLSEQRRSNLARELETRRSNMANEALAKQRNYLTDYQNREVSRSNRANEAIRQQTNYLGRTELAETRRSNEARERIQLKQHYENMRRNSLVYDIDQARNQISLLNLDYNYANLDQTRARDTDTQAYRILDLQERTRANKATERNQLLRSGIDAIGTLVKLVSMKGAKNG